MINIYEGALERIIAMYITSDEPLEEKIGANLERAKEWLTNNYLGQALVQEFDNLPLAVSRPIVEAVCLEAFASAIPMLDLVLTSSGFGVVSNSNIAPASRERVNALRAQIEAERDNALDRLVYALRVAALPSWQNSPVLANCIPSLLYRGEDLQQHAGMPKATRSDLLRMMPEIHAAEAFICESVSPDYYHGSLLPAFRSNYLSTADEHICAMLCGIIGAFITKSVGIEHLLKIVVAYMDRDVDKYPAYRDSSLYKSKHAKPYENNQSDSTYFW